MNDPERPPLDPIVIDEIRASVYQIDQKYYPLIGEFRIACFIPLTNPVPLPRPAQFVKCLQEYASLLFTVEADHYERFRGEGRHPQWVRRLADRIVLKVLDAVEKIDQGNLNVTVWNHGITQPDMKKAVQDALGKLANQYEWKDAGPRPQAEPVKESTTPQALKSEPAARQRMSATIHSPSAARKMVEYMNAKGMNQTEFSIQAQTTEKTIRKFRQTGKIKGSILAVIASAMGISREELLNL
jgi:hypothetical protein